MTEHLESWLLLFSFALSALTGRSKSHDVAAEAPPPAKVITAADEGLFPVDH